MGPFAGIAVTSVVLALGTGIVLTAMVARGAEVLARAAQGRRRRIAPVQPVRRRGTWAAQVGVGAE
jgi:hypothetical protein